MAVCHTSSEMRSELLGLTSESNQEFCDRSSKLEGTADGWNALG